MSAPVSLEERRRLPLRQRLRPLAAVGAARLLAHLPPRRLCALLHLLARKARPATYDEALAARSRVVAVSLLCAGDGCLPRSIATALLCRSHGSWPTWRSGVRTNPFYAHAWVEAEGRPVGEPRARSFTPILTV